MNRLVFAMPGNEALASQLAHACSASMGALTTRRFPDGESYVRIDSDVRDRDVVLVCTLDRPDEKLIPLLFACDTLRALGAARIVLVAPYLAYMRQDIRFQPGETLANGVFARVISQSVDRLITVDPHLHRVHALDEIYRVPSTVVHAAPAIARWIATHVDGPVLIGPDSESDQWVREVAALAGAPFHVMTKTRKGDRDVEIAVTGIESHSDRTPVLVDDIISTGSTMIATIGHLRSLGLRPAVCIGVHAVFAGSAWENLQRVAARVVTCDTIAHASNQISLVAEIAEAIIAIPEIGTGS